ncbi:hypothetical protein NDU88_006331 [Pleurodeles waltl]|uniref:Uncharacterized protein n=1 Tax=Pleurodeles waltl TaxID=8319 RepID=A0AAV7MDL5_PLEWA|nr:hypothetical protein NDU88_006331 [Pleurodeles waltl]
MGRIMPPKKASAPKRNGRDPELSQLLRLVLEKLGRDDAVEVTESSVNEVGGDKNSRPKRSHVAPSAAFPAVKRRRNGKTPVPASSEQTCAAVVNPPVQTDIPEPPPLVPAPPLVTQGVAVDSSASPVLGLEGVLADILEIRGLPGTLNTVKGPSGALPSHPITRGNFNRSVTCGAACTPPNSSDSRAPGPSAGPIQTSVA